MNHFLQSNRQQRRVLVVDDEMINRELLETILSMTYDVTSVSNGMDALEILRREPKAFSLILLDIIMPQMSGFDVIKVCKDDEVLKDIPIIVMTTEKSAEVRSIRLGAADFIPKPYRMPEVIIARCERIIELDEEKKLIRSIEKDPVTKLYVRLFFDAYLGRLVPAMRGAMDAVAIKIDGLDSLPNQKEKDRVLKKIADLMMENIISSKGIACRTDDSIFLGYCRHKENYEELMAGIKGELLKDIGARGITLRTGICERADKNEPTFIWFEKAIAFCATLPVDGDRLTAVCS